MPKSNLKITAPLRGALLECFRATTRLVRPGLRRQLVLHTEDVDVAAPPDVLSDIVRRVLDGAPSFSLESDGKIAFDAPQGFRVRIDLIQVGGGCIDKIYATRPLFGASVASKSDLLRLRAVTVVERESDGEVDDFRWLLAETAREGQVLPELDKEDLEYVTGAGACLGELDRLVLVAVLGANNGAAALRLLGL
ncbi:hypothetical protein B0I35DRAFT_494696 [Stachybotrys elegans]|uniref:Uncharacterized protein n=1 Tax=Stachybotrys elegans TaxID=80388 RepID=A0A8K0WJT1_9HYPO|nr:hypothetical protein B0I35DRAFT_494696 [Stachybotrys elegans]